MESGIRVLEPENDYEIFPCFVTTKETPLPGGGVQADFELFWGPRRLADMGNESDCRIDARMVVAESSVGPRGAGSPLTTDSPISDVDGIVLRAAAPGNAVPSLPAAPPGRR